jgi:uncharacterized protein (DUF433 family)
LPHLSKKPREILTMDTGDFMTTELETEHPHIVKVPGVLGGEPLIARTRIGVAFIARLLQAGEEPSEIIAAFPHLAAASVYDAISYYLDHREEIDDLVADSTLEALAERYGFRINKRGRVEFGSS